MGRLLASLVAGLILAAAVPAVASAVISVSIANRTLTIVGSTGDDDVAIGSAGSNALGPTTDVTGGGQDMSAGAGCQGFGDPNGPANDNSVFCPTNDFDRIQVTLDQGEDEFRSTGTFPVVADAGSGDDNITTGRGPDTVLGGPGDDVIDVDQNTTSGTSTSVDGGVDDDEILIGRDNRPDDVAGGGGQDTVSYAFAASGRRVSLDDQPNDGGTTEGDNVRSDVETVVGSGSGDTLIGNVLAQTLDGAGGTDRLEGLGGPDILIGGPGTLDATFGGPGEDDIRLRDGLVDECPDGGPDADVFDLDLVDQTITFGRLTIPRCIFPRIRGISFLGDAVFVGAVKEGPNALLAVRRPVVRPAGARVVVSCPAALRRRCSGTLSVATLRGARPLGSVGYAVRPGRRRAVVVPLDLAARAAALRAPLLRLAAVERGRLGAKTSVLVTRP
jgi:Ca2+-binding RTX toxin-like protein